MTAPLAPAWQTTHWFNNAAPLGLADLKGKVILLHAFQMLCPACVRQAVPQAQRIFQQVNPADVAVIGLHTVFENHAVMTVEALAVFIRENRLTFPIGVDTPDGQDGMPLTMRAYQMQGTPSLLLFDRNGRLRLHHFGHVDDLALGIVLGQLIQEPDTIA
jgi:peroxiredoxin